MAARGRVYALGHMARWSGFRFRLWGLGQACLVAGIDRRQRPRVRVGPHGALVGL